MKKPWLLLKLLYLVLFIFCIPNVASSQEGWFTRANCATELPAPTVGTVCTQTTTAGNFLSGDILKWNGVAWVRIYPHITNCEVVFNNTNGLADTDDQPGTCGNVTGSDLVITAVACRADAGSPTVLPILTGGGVILTGTLTCGNGTFVAGSVSGTPTVRSFSANGATCSVTPCTLDANIASATTAKNIVLRFTMVGK